MLSIFTNFHLIWRDIFSFIRGLFLREDDIIRTSTPLVAVSTIVYLSFYFQTRFRIALENSYIFWTFVLFNFASSDPLYFHGPLYFDKSSIMKKILFISVQINFDVLHETTFAGDFTNLCSRKYLRKYSNFLSKIWWFTFQSLKPVLTKTS